MHHTQRKKRKVIEFTTQSDAQFARFMQLSAVLAAQSSSLDARICWLLEREAEINGCAGVQERSIKSAGKEIS